MPRFRPQILPSTAIWLLSISMFFFTTGWGCEDGTTTEAERRCNVIKALASTDTCDEAAVEKAHRDVTALGLAEAAATGSLVVGGVRIVGGSRPNNTPSYRRLAAEYPLENEPKKTCPRCNGDDYERDKKGNIKHERCSKCKGKGANPSGDIACDHCEGKGTVEKFCTLCGGRGTVDHLQSHPEPQGE